jgi:predicted dehydrogenase
VVSVDARTRRAVSTTAGKGEDVACLSLEFAGGVLATVTATWADTSLPTRFERLVLGTMASARVVEEGPDSRLIVAEGGTIRETRSHRDWWWETNAAAIAELVEDLSDRKRSVAEAPEAYRTLRTLLAAYRAARTARRVEL